MVRVFDPVQGKEASGLQDSFFGFRVAQPAPSVKLGEIRKAKWLRSRIAPAEPGFPF
jgi:hypothetical protein